MARRAKKTEAVQPPPPVIDTMAAPEAPVTAREPDVPPSTDATIEAGVIAAAEAPNDAGLLTALSLEDVALEIAKAHGHDDPAEVSLIVAEQALNPEERARSRYHRRANESLCQIIESHALFKASLQTHRS